MDFAQVKQLEQDYIMPTYGRFPVALEAGKGARVRDVAGKEYLDFGSGIGVNALGFCDADWADAVSAQAHKLNHTSNLYYSSIQGQLAQKLCALSGMDKVFYCNSGAESNEGAIKLARKYSYDKYGEGRSTIVTLENSFHGRTITTLAATGQDVFHNYFFPFTGGFTYAKANDLESVKAVLDESVCAIVLEGVQGEGGVIPLSEAFVSGVAALCREKDILLLFDEVQTGIGRTGKMFSYQHFGILPDVVSCAKGLGGGLPFGAVLCTKALAGVLGAGSHATTFGGNPICCAGSMVVLDKVGAPDFLAQVEKKGAYIREKIAAMNLPGFREARGKGLMLGIEIAGLDVRQAILDLLDKGLIVLSAKTAIRLLPPLNITYEEIDEGLAILASVLKG